MKAHTVRPGLIVSAAYWASEKDWTKAHAVRAERSEGFDSNAIEPFASLRANGGCVTRGSS